MTNNDDKLGHASLVGGNRNEHTECTSFDSYEMR